MGTTTKGQANGHTRNGHSSTEPGKGRISFESPVGKALLGKRVGDSVAVTTPGGATSMLIVEVH